MAKKFTPWTNWKKAILILSITVYLDPVKNKSCENPNLLDISTHWKGKDTNNKPSLVKRAV